MLLHQLSLVIGQKYLEYKGEELPLKILEQDGFQVVYSAYKWTDRRDVATEIAEEDITLTVTEEYISLDCAKDDYAMYLSVADSSTVAQYLYNYNRRTKSATEGEWYAYEHQCHLVCGQFVNLRLV